MSLLYQYRLFLPQMNNPVPLFHCMFFIYTQSGEKARFIKKIQQKKFDSRTNGMDRTALPLPSVTFQMTWLMCMALNFPPEAFAAFAS